MSSKPVYVLADAGYEHNTVVGIFDTREAAEAEKAYCEANDDDMKRRWEDGFTNDGHGHYYIAEYRLNESRAHLLFRFDKDGKLTEKSFFSAYGRSGEVRQYDEVWDDGTCCDVSARTEDEARGFLQSTVIQGGAT